MASSTQDREVPGQNTPMAETNQASQDPPLENDPGQEVPVGETAKPDEDRRRLRTRCPHG